MVKILYILFTLVLIIYLNCNVFLNIYWHDFDSSAWLLEAALDSVCKARQSKKIKRLKTANCNFLLESMENLSLSS